MRWFWRQLRRAAEGTAHLILIPVDLLFLLVDLFWVNFQKTRLLRLDCRGPLHKGGGACPPARKYTHRRLIRCVCADAVLHKTTRSYICHATQRTRIYVLRGAVLLAVYAAVLAAGLATAVTYWPRTTAPERSREQVLALIRERMDAAQKAFEADRYDECVEIAGSVLRLEPETPGAYYLMGLCYERLDRKEEAHRFFRTAVLREGAPRQAYEKAARYDYDKGFVASAGLHARRAIEAGITDAALHAIVADDLISRNEAAQGREALSRALAAGAEAPVVRLVQAHVLIKDERLAEAEAMLAALRETEVPGPMYGLYRIMLLGKQGRIAEALALLKDVCATYSDLAWLRLYEVQKYFDLGMTSEALGVVESLEDRAMLSPSFRMQLAGILEKSNQEARAIQIAQDYVRDARLGWSARILLGNAYLRKGLIELAAYHATLALSERPSERESRLLAGRVALSENQPQDARRHFEAAVAAVPDDAWSRYLLGRTEVMLGDSAAGIGNLKRASELAPNTPEFSIRYGAALAEAGQDGAARDALLRAVELAPDSVEALTQLGILAQRAGQTAEAERYYERAINTDPRTAVAAGRNLAMLLLEQEKDLGSAAALAYGAYTNARGTPLEAQTADAVAAVLIKLGEASRALNFARVAMQIKPVTSLRCQRLGLAEASVGNLDAAIEAFDRAIKVAADPALKAQAESLLAAVKKRQAEQKPQ